MYTIIYFSPTGNTKHLSSLLAYELNIEAVDVHILERTDPMKIIGDTHLIILYPIHGFNPPRTVKRFIKNLPESTNREVNLIAVGCNELWLNDAVSNGLRKLLIRKGYNIIVDEIIAMPITLVMGMSEEIYSDVVQKAESKISELALSIEQKKVSDRKVHFKSKIVSAIGKLESPAARMFGLELHATKDCTSCGICWNNCPENNISKNKKDKPRFGFSCSMCLRCIYRCPDNAIHPYISRFIPIKGGYQEPQKEKD